MSPAMAAAIERALDRERATGNSARVIDAQQTIVALQQRGWVNTVRVQVDPDRPGVSTFSGELTQAGRDAYRAHCNRYTYPLTDKALAGLRLVREYAAQDRDAQGSLPPRTFGNLRGRGLIERDQHRQIHVLTEAGTAALDQADEIGDTT